MGVSESRVSQLHSQTVARLRASLRGESVDRASLIGIVLVLVGILPVKYWRGRPYRILLQPAALPLSLLVRLERCSYRVDCQFSSWRENVEVGCLMPEDKAAERARRDDLECCRATRRFSVWNDTSIR